MHRDRLDRVKFLRHQRKVQARRVQPIEQKQIWQQLRNVLVELDQTVNKRSIAHRYVNLSSCTLQLFIVYCSSFVPTCTLFPVISSNINQR